MIDNESVARLTEIREIRSFIEKNCFVAKSCSRWSSLILFRLPFVIEVTDFLIENFLHITLSDLDSELMLVPGMPTACSTRLGLQDQAILSKLNFESHPQNDLFLSYGGRKMYDLQVQIEAIDKLLPIVEKRGGLASLRSLCDTRMSGDFDPLDKLWDGLKARYLNCIAEIASDSL